MCASPVVAKTGDIGQFFEDLANKPLLQMLDDLDAWCANGLRGIVCYFLMMCHIQISAGMAQAKKRTQDCKKFCRNQLKLELRQYTNPLASPADTSSIGQASGDGNAELRWKYYSTQVCLKYNLHLVGFPQEAICDPSDLSVSELFAL